MLSVGVAGRSAATTYICGGSWRRATSAYSTYELRHASASLLIHEGKFSFVEIAAHRGHSLNVRLASYGT